MKRGVCGVEVFVYYVPNEECPAVKVAGHLALNEKIEGRSRKRDRARAEISFVRSFDDNAEFRVKMRNRDGPLDMPLK